MEFKIRASAAYEICAGTIGLTEKQQVKFNELTERKIANVKPLTANMEKELEELIFRLKNTEPTSGMQTYCKNWLKEHLYKRRKQIKNRYLSKGNETEEDGFTLMALEKKLGMVKQNAIFKSNEFAMGTCDLFHDGVIYDHKASWDLSTFPMFEKEIPDDKYDWQGNTYDWLYGAKKHIICYTLIDCPESVFYNEIKWLSDDNEKQKIAVNLIYTKEYFDAMKSRHFNSAEKIDFVEIPRNKRIKSFEFEYSQAKTDELIKRVKMCRKFIETLI